MTEIPGITAPHTYAGDIKASAMIRNIVFLNKRFDRQVFQGRTSSAC